MSSECSPRMGGGGIAYACHRPFLPESTSLQKLCARTHTGSDLLQLSNNQMNAIVTSVAPSPHLCLAFILCHLKHDTTYHMAEYRSTQHLYMEMCIDPDQKPENQNLGGGNGKPKF